ncbi:MAG: hypothetical protein AAF601_13910 [Pseudomonadota bacterium]
MFGAWVVSTFIAYIAVLLTMLLGLIGTIFETRRAGRLTAMGRVAVGLIVVSGLISLVARYVANEAAQARAAAAEQARVEEAARAARADADRQEALASAQAQRAALQDAQAKIDDLETALAASQRREELALRRSADVRLKLKVGFERQLAFTEGRWAERYAFLVDEGTNVDPRISEAAIALCQQDTRDLCVVDIWAEPTQEALDAGNARGGGIRLSAAYDSRLWTALRQGPLDTRLYPPQVYVGLGPPWDRCLPDGDGSFQFVFEPRAPDARGRHAAVEISDAQVPVCIPDSFAGSFWALELSARSDTDGYMVKENPRLLLELKGADPGYGWMLLSVSYDIKLDPLVRLEDVAGQVMQLGVYSLPLHSEVDFDCAGTDVMTPGFEFSLEADGRAIAFRDLDHVFYEQPWDADWRGFPAAPGAVAYDPARMWLLSGRGAGCSGEIVLRFPQDPDVLSDLIGPAR